ALHFLVDDLCDALLPDHTSKALHRLQAIQNNLDEITEQQTRTIMLLGLSGAVLLLILVIVGLLWLNITWDLVEPSTIVLSILGTLVAILYYIFARERLSLENIEERIRA